MFSFMTLFMEKNLNILKNSSSSLGGFWHMWIHIVSYPKRQNRGGAAQPRRKGRACPLWIQTLWEMSLEPFLIPGRCPWLMVSFHPVCSAKSIKGGKRGADVLTWRVKMSTGDPCILSECSSCGEIRDMGLEL